MINVSKSNFSLLKRIKKPRILFLLSLVVLAVLGSMYMRNTWATTMNETSKQAMNTARTAEAGFQKGEITKLDISIEDINKQQYKQIKNALMKLRSMNEGVRFAYIYTQKDGKIYFVADSESVDSKDYSPPGQEYTEADKVYLTPFNDGKELITTPTIDRWGTWISILIPMKDFETGKTIAVFGIDYPAQMWTNEAISHTLQAGIIVFVLFLLLFSFYIILSKNMLLKEKRNKLEFANKEIASSEEKFRNIFEGSLDAIFLDYDTKVVDCNLAMVELLGYDSKACILGKCLKEFSPEKQPNGEYSKEKAFEMYKRAMKNGKCKFEWWYKRSDGKLLPVEVMMTTILHNEKKVFHSIWRDISERKQMENKFEYLSYHDQLTGLYNRRFFTEEINRLDVQRNLPITIVMGDVNGLKLINDSFGHAMGDDLLKIVAEVIRLGCRADDIIARLGGDEFVIILPKTSAFETEQIIKRITNLSLSEKVGSIDISISFGYETKNNEEEKIQDIFKNAEDHMYKKKLFESPSMRGKTIRAIINTLFEKNKREEQHSHRVSALCKSMGEALKMSEYENKELKSVGLLHDIGKIAIDENVLNKPGKLTDDEWKEIKRHPEIGYRILSTVNDMSEMAEYVLAHHERWDGKGYPKGLKGKEIPFVSRIITIADAYDAMTSERSYRSALPKEVAIEELQKNAGSQFDPELVSVFIEKVLGKISGL